MKKLLCVLLLFFSSQGIGQKYNFRNYTVANGLAQSQINDINQDHLGYLWVATESGLSKFSGHEFVNYSMGDGLPDNKIEKIYFDEENVMWIGTPNGIARFENNKFVPYLFAEPNRINDMEHFHDQLFVATNSGLFKLQGKELVLVNPEREEQLYIRALVNLDEKELICGSRTGIYSFISDFQPFRDSIFLNYNISDLELVGSELIFSTYGDGLLQYSFEDKFLKQYELEYNRIRSIYADSSVILCSSINGLIEISDQVSYYDESNGLINQSLVCSFRDREGNYWIGTDGNGLLKFLGRSVITYSTDEGLSSNLIMTITQTLDSTYIFGSYGEGLSMLSMDGKLRHFNEENGLSNNKVWDIFPDEGGDIWIGTTGGVNCIKNGQFINQEITSKIPSKTRSIERIGDKYFFGGTEGLYIMSQGQVLYLDHTRDMNINDLCVVGDDIYVGGRNGLYLLEASSNYSTASLVETPENTVHSLVYDSRGLLWIGTENGLYIRFSDGNLTPFDLDRSDFKSKTILSLLESSDHDIWVSTMSGVYQIESRPKESQSYKINHFSTPQGLMNLEANLNAIYEDFDHKIWVGTSNGLARIDPSLNDVLFDFKRPELHLTGIRLFMEEIDYDRFEVEYTDSRRIPTSISLPYDQNHLTFDFIGINLKNPESVYFQYRLSGANETWSPLSSAQYATYSDVPPGNYTFEVRATNKSFAWSEIASIEVTIRAPFWQTWWFILSALIISLLIVASIFQARIRTIKQKQENEKLSYKNRLLFLEQQSLNASMNRHFIFNSLNSIQYFINSSDKLSANKYLSSFAKLIRKNLDSSTNNNFIVTLQEEIDRIELYMTLEKMRFQDKFDYKLNVSSALDTEGTEIPSMILQPFVENSIIHGVLPLDRKGLIEINIYEEYGEVIFEVIDDGIGYDNTMRTKKSTISGDHESKGMEITNRRIELLRKLTGENLLIIGPFQLNNENGECKGTKVIIKMGLHNEE
ncbi:MAG: histidine kinase [Crocinitomicaceae bacterium]|nr:histidine kinase [Crocinitomicaceae bacterium]